MKRLLLSLTIACLILIFLPLITIRLFQQSDTFPPTTNAQTTDANFKVAFVGDSGASSAFQSVLNLIKNENAHMVLHQGDLDYSDGPTKWIGMVNTTLGANFPYLASDGNHDEWDADGYAAFFKDRITKMGLTAPTGNLSSSYAVTYKGLKIVFSKENGDPTFIDTQLKTATNTWKICSWHKNMKLMQIGGKGDEQGWPDYETCRKYGAIIATGHEHSYERTKTMTNTQTQTIDSTCSDPKNVCVAPGKTFVFVSGLGGSSIRNQDLCLPSTPPYGCNGLWASIYTSDQGAKEGALFIIFNYNGNPNKAHAYFKNISGQIIDEFDITASGGTNPPPSTSPTGSRPSPRVTSQPTITTRPGTTNLSLNVKLHGIGNGGDNANPNSTYSTSPLHPNRQITATLTSVNNVTSSPLVGTVSFTSGVFQGIVALGTSIPSGSYIMRIQTPGFLMKQYPGFYTVSSGQTLQLPQIALVNGDTNRDNSLSILDYNLILDCFSDLEPASNCTTEKLSTTDITDDGSVDQFDYNLFLRELSVQSGI